MFKEALIALCIGFAAATTCESDSVDGTWFFLMDTAVVSHAHGGEELNPKYNCFDVSKDNTATQKFRVDLKSPLVTAAMPLAGVDNEKYCVDKQLRTEIAEAVKDAEDSCEGHVKALASKLNRPGWAMNCVSRSPKGFNFGFFGTDQNFCHFDAVKGGKVYSLTVVKLDKSEPQPEPEE
ncbi:hypothetical protein V3C99_014276 [Haemonchus contortus]|uniref:NIM-1 protein n=1 Tax=Haemonchus contortus TaxID=6289 RepID=Q4QYX6_HAECO|nr:NIM-1 protein [Haemonchus contortus]CDJ98193.1 Hypothetical protein CBG02858 [Haemonchus contortus]